MFSSSTVIICSSCVGEVRPSGYIMKTSTPRFPRNPEMADEPVSPEVAPTTVIVCGSPSACRFMSRCSKRLPKNWSATSLKAYVGPWCSSSTCIPSGSVSTGVTALERHCGGRALGRRLEPSA
eukprot:scaffold104562_cov26-Tisochrysis_lutea.AAC.2